MAPLLRNGNFEAKWSEERSPKCIRIGIDGAIAEVEVGDIFSPPGWTVWFREEEGRWAEPEGREAIGTDPDRMRCGERGYMLFTYSQKMDAGLLQQVKVTPGSRLSFEIWAHAWSNHSDESLPERYLHPDDPMWSEGSGFEPYIALEGGLEGDLDETDLSNFTFWVGIDPKGGRDPFAKGVAWSQGTHIYNRYGAVPAVEVTAKSDIVTVFTRARTRYSFKHNDAYWDDAVLEVVVEEDMKEREGSHGGPRIQYERLYVLLPPGADQEWAKAVVEATWDDNRYTIGASADDAGIGNLDSRIVLVVNPDMWGGPKVLREFFDEHYPGVRYRSVSADTPEELAKILLEK